MVSGNTIQLFSKTECSLKTSRKLSSSKRTTSSFGIYTPTFSISFKLLSHIKDTSIYSKFSKAGIILYTTRESITNTKRPILKKTKYVSQKDRSLGGNVIPVSISNQQMKFSKTKMGPSTLTWVFSTQILLEAIQKQLLTVLSAKILLDPIFKWRTILNSWKIK